MNPAEFVRSLNVFDLLVLFFLFAFFVVGYIQGTIRRLLGLAAVLFSFVLAANLRDPLGAWFAPSWRQFPEQYSYLIAFGLVFSTALIVTTLLIQTFYEKVELWPRYPVIDEVIGGLLGILEGLLLVGCVIVILDSYFQIPNLPQSSNELPFLRDLHEAIDPSGTASLYRQVLIPAFFAILSPFLPESLKSLFR